MKRRLQTLAASALLAGAAHGADILVDENIAEDTVWTNDNVYILDGFIFVTDGANLTIEAGTLITAMPGTGAQASNLAITRGSKIFAMGTPSQPIIFTVVGDPLDGSLTPDQGGQWGGLVLLGQAPLNSNKSGTVSDDGIIEESIEGIPDAFGDLNRYGGDDPEDSSGILRYVSIRFGGSPLVANEEINGLSMGGVGSNTIVEFVEVFANADDGFEWFGGTVNSRYLVSAFNGDDYFDYDQGFVGQLQFLFGVSNSDLEGANPTFSPDNGFEMDGEETSLSDLIGGATIANATIIGGGDGAGNALRLRDNGFVRMFNSAFTGFPDAAFRIEPDSADRIPADPANPGEAEVEVGYNTWDENSFAGTSPADLADGDEGGGDDEQFVWTTGSLQNEVDDIMLRGDSRGTAAFEGDGMLDPRPAPGSPLFSNPRQDLSEYPFFRSVGYQGAFGGANWMFGWTQLDEAGYLPEVNAPAGAQAVNISTRTFLEGGSFVIPGFVVVGDLPRAVLVRAVGPKLGDRGVDNPMADPRLSLRDVEGNEILAVDDWGEEGSGVTKDALEAVFGTIGAAPLSATGDEPTDDTASAAAYVVLEPGIYTVLVDSADGSAGEVLVEVFDADL